MSNDPVGRRPRSADLHSKLRLAALAAVVAGVVVLAAAAFVLSYEGIHQIALRAGVSPGLAKLYPVIFDVMLVIAAAAALALRGAGWWARCYAWGLLLILLAAVAIGNAVHATGITLPTQPTKVVVAVTPWVLLLMAFGLLLEMLRHFRTTRSAAAKATAAADVSASTGPGADVNGGPRAPGAQAAAPGNAASGNNVRELPRVNLDTLLGPRAGQPPSEVPHHTETGDNGAHQADPVSYGEETGYVHPDSYLDEGEYSPHGDTGGPGSPAERAGDHAGDGTYPARNGTSAAEASAAPAEAMAISAETPAAATEAPAAAAAETSATSGETPATSGETPATSGETPATATPATVTPAEVTATPAETPAAPAETVATPAETPAAATATPAEAPATGAPATAGEAVLGSENGQAAGEGRAAATTPAGPDGTAEEAGEAPALERIRSTPTRPE
jgi:hypothetical protein